MLGYDFKIAFEAPYAAVDQTPSFALSALACVKTHRAASRSQLLLPGRGC